MSEERKSEESLMDDETLFRDYLAAIIAGRNCAMSLVLHEEYRKQAVLAIAEHRKLFPKKVPQDSPCDCGSECVKCSPNKLDKPG